MRFAHLYVLTTVILLSCDADDSRDHSRLLVQLPTTIRSTKLLANENKAHVVTYFGSLYETQTELYSVDLESSALHKMLTGEGSCDNGFAISSDEKFAILSTYIQKSNGYESRIEMHDIENQTHKILISSHENSFGVYTIHPENNFLLYNKYVNGRNTIRKRNLLNDDDVQISGNENAVVVGLHPLTNEILVDTYTRFYFMDWDGVIKGEPVNGLTPVSISNNGKAILCSKNGEIYSYDITTKEEIQVSNAGGNLNPRCFSADGNSILFSTNKDHLEGSSSYELYTMDTSGENIIRHTFNEESEFPLGFFQQDTRILFTGHKNDKALYALEF